jgi:hypothetical protein
MNPIEKVVMSAGVGAALAALIVSSSLTHRALAGELGTLRLRNRELSNLRTGNEELRRSVARLTDVRKAQIDSAARAAEEAAANPDFIPVTNLRNVGSRTVKGALETYLWSLTNQDVAALARMLVLSKPSKAKVAAIYDALPQSAQAQYENSDEMFAMLYLEQHPTYFSAARVTSDEPAPDERSTVPTTQYEYPNGSITTHHDLPMKLTADGWGVQVSGAQVSRFLRQLTQPATFPSPTN